MVWYSKCSSVPSGVRQKCLGRVENITQLFTSNSDQLGSQPSLCVLTASHPPWVAAPYFSSNSLETHLECEEKPNTMCNITKLQVLWNLEKETPSPCGIELGYFWFDIGDITVRNTFQDAAWRLQLTVWELLLRFKKLHGRSFKICKPSLKWRINYLFTLVI